MRIPESSQFLKERQGGMKAEYLLIEETKIQNFLSFPDTLYRPEFRTENKKELAQIIRGEHPLSHYFQAIPFLVEEQGRILARAVLTFYPEDSTAYLGYFESLDNDEAVRLLLDFAEKESLDHAKKKIAGPLNASFWLGYRLKVNHFNRRPYFSELYHLDYYKKLWEGNGFDREATYYSNHYNPVDEQMDRNKYLKRYKQFKGKGYQIVSPARKTLNHDFLAVAELIQDRFQTFPVFKTIQIDEFLQLFSDLKAILNRKYVKIAYSPNGELAGFLISVPDYGTLFNQEKLNLRAIVQFLFKKYTSREYIILYMAVKEGHEGLGSALVYSLMEEYNKRKIKATSSYIHEGKVSGGYAFGSVYEQSEYAYYSKRIK